MSSHFTNTAESISDLIHVLTVLHCLARCHRLLSQFREGYNHSNALGPVSPLPRANTVHFSWRTLCVCHCIYSSHRWIAIQTPHNASRAPNAVLSDAWEINGLWKLFMSVCWNCLNALNQSLRGGLSALRRAAISFWLMLPSMPRRQTNVCIEGIDSTSGVHQGMRACVGQF